MDHFIDFEKEKLKLKKIYESDNASQIMIEPVSACDKTISIYGDFKMPKLRDDRPYLYGSFVISVDGKIAYPEDPDGTLIARSNQMDPDGGMCDYWILNLLRAVSDASIVGAQTIAKEPDLTSLIYDKDLQNQRKAEGLSAVPVHVITSKDGRDVPISHHIFNSDIPFIIATSPEGAEYLRSQNLASVKEIIYQEDANDENDNGNIILVTGEGNTPNVADAMYALRKMGLKRIVVESPTYLSLLMQENMLDEMFLNTSGIFIGGDALSISKWMNSFTLDAHPHLQTMTIHTHSDYFFYTRYQLIYDQ